VVISDRYIDSSVAYQARPRPLGDGVARISRWATGGLVPHLNVLLDVSPEPPGAFHEAPDRLSPSRTSSTSRCVRFLALAERSGRYLVIDATT